MHAYINPYESKNRSQTQTIFWIYLSRNGFYVRLTLPCSKNRKKTIKLFSANIVVILILCYHETFFTLILLFYFKGRARVIYMLR